jgi:sugar phosphate isomerase/epimerase
MPTALTPTTPDLDRAADCCEDAPVRAVRLDGAAVESTARPYLRALKRGLRERGLTPASVSVAADFSGEGPLAAQTESDRLREYVEAAAFLGADRLAVRVGEGVDDDRTETALAALEERAAREGVDLRVERGQRSREEGPATAVPGE